MRFISTDRQSHAKAWVLDWFVPFASVISTIIVFGLLFGVWIRPTHSSGPGQLGCSSDASLTLRRGGLASTSAWYSAHLLGVSMAFGNYSLATAKTIDVACDLAIGRGGQFMIALIVGNTMRRSLLVSLAKGSWSVPTVTTVILGSGSVGCLFALIKGILCERLARDIWRTTAFIVMLIYLTLFGPVVSAMTGYRAALALPSQFEFFQNGSTIPGEQMSSSISPLLIRGTGDLPGELETARTIPVTPADQPVLFRALQDYESLRRSCLDNADSQNTSGTCHDDQTTMYSISIDWQANTDNFRTLTTSKLTVENETYSLSSPAPSIVTTTKPDLFFNDTISGTVRNFTWLKDNNVCVPLRTYQWGCSIPLLVAFCALTLMFLLAWLALHRDLWEHRRHGPVKEEFCIYRDVLDLAGEIRTLHGEQVDYMSARDLKKAMASTTSAVQIERVHRAFPFSSALEHAEGGSGSHVGRGSEESSVSHDVDCHSRKSASRVSVSTDLKCAESRSRF